MTAKEYAGRCGGFEMDPRAVSADAPRSEIAMTIEFSDRDRAFVKDKWTDNCPATDEIVVEIRPSGDAQVKKRSRPTELLLSWYSRAYLNSPGFFDFIDSHRFTPKKQLSTWNTEFLSDNRAKAFLGVRGVEKFQFTKDYLASLAMKDAQDLLRSKRDGNPVFPDSLKPIRDFFNEFFAPMRFLDVRIDTSPFQYVIGTPRGEIDLDDLSGGEKEVLVTFIRFHQLQPRGAVILFDEADAHLHPDLERRYLEVLRRIGKDNQLWVTTHSPEMMIDAGSKALYTVLKEPPAGGGSQFVRVTEKEELHRALSEVMGSRGLVSFNQRIIFIEGENASADRFMYETLYPPAVHNVSFVPAGNSATVRSVAERVNTLLTAGIGFQQYFSIVDGDIDRSESDPTGGTRLFKLPVYHVENFLLDEVLIFDAVCSLLGSQCPYTSPADVDRSLRELVLGDAHVKPYTRALLDARVAKVAKAAADAVYKDVAAQDTERPRFGDIEKDARQILQAYLADGQWKARCKGRDLLKAFCSKHELEYEHFRNLVLSKMKKAPEGLDEIMRKILGR
jgi:hypothetical protein